MKILKNTSIYTVTSILNSGISLLLLPVFTRYLTPADYGIVSMFLMTTNFLVPIIGLSSYGAIQVEYYKAEKGNFRDYLSTAIITNVIIGLLFFVLFLLMSLRVNEYKGLPATALLCVPLMALFQIFSQIILTLLQIENKPFQFSMYNIFQAIFNIGTGVLFVVFIGLGWEGRLIGLLITGVIFLFVGVWILAKRGWLVYGYNKLHLHDLLRFGLPLVPHAFSASVILYMDKMMLAGIINVGEMGIYNVGFQIASIIGVLESSFAQAFTPFQFESIRENTEEAKSRIVKFSYLFFLFIMVSIILLHFLGPTLLGYFIGEKYQDGFKYVLVVSLGYFFSAVYKIFVNYIFYFKKTVYLSYAAVINTVLVIGLDYFLIIRFGVIGAAYAFTLAMFIYMVMIMIVSHKLYPLPWIKFIFKLK